jgi:hypothetical protein
LGKPLGCSKEIYRGLQYGLSGQSSHAIGNIAYQALKGNRPYGDSGYFDGKTNLTSSRKIYFIYHHYFFIFIFVPSLSEGKKLQLKFIASMKKI